MKRLNRYRQRLILALLVSALLNLSLLAALSTSFRPEREVRRAPSVYPQLAVAFLSAGGEPPAEVSPAERAAGDASRKTAQADAPEERLNESRETPPVSDTLAEAAAGPPSGAASAEGAAASLQEADRQGDDPHSLGGLPAKTGSPRPTQDEFLILLQELISENLVYPRRARQRGIEGTVILELTIDAEGILRSRRIERESGSSMLDRAALALLDTVFPVSVKPGYDLDCSVSVSYRLN